MIAERPFERLLSRLPDAKRRGDRAQARCPAHGDRGPSLSVKETSDQTVVVHCFAGCTPVAIVNAVGLELRDLFPARSEFEQRTIDREHDALMRRFATDRKGVLRERIDHELQVERERLRASLGYYPPLTSTHINNARRRVGLLLGIELKPIAPLEWECPPHDTDPLWPLLFTRALEDETRRRWHAFEPAAAPDATDPQGANAWDRIRAQELAARWLHEIAAGAAS